MKRKNDILGLKVISIAEGCSVGIIKEVVIDPREYFIKALLVSNEKKWFYGAEVLPFENIVSIGEFGIMINTTTCLAPLHADNEIISMLNTDINLIGVSVLSKNGMLLGTTIDYIFNDKGKIIYCEIEKNATSEEIIHLPTEEIMSIGKEFLITSTIPPNYENNSHETSESLSGEILSLVYSQTPAQAVNAQKEIETTNDDSNYAVKLLNFEEKNRKILLGKRANRRVETDNGMLIIDYGCEITEEVLQKAKLTGKFNELANSI